MILYQIVVGGGFLIGGLWLGLQALSAVWREGFVRLALIYLAGALVELGLALWTLLLAC